MTPATVQKALQYSPSPDFQKQVFGDLLRKRNRHLLDEIQTRLPQSDNIIVPWGWPTCRRLQRKFKSPASAWMKAGNTK